MCFRVLRFFTAFVFLMQYCPPQAFPDQLFHCLLLSKNHDIGLKNQNEIFTNRAMSWRALCFVVNTWREAVCLKCAWNAGDQNLALHPSPYENVSLAGTGGDGPSVLGATTLCCKQQVMPREGPSRLCCMLWDLPEIALCRHCLLFLYSFMHHFFMLWPSNLVVPRSSLLW